MRSLTLSLFALVLAVPALDPALAQPKPCALVCQPPDKLDAEQCKCVKPSVVPPKPCALVCLGPDEILDAKQCKCVKK